MLDWDLIIRNTMILSADITKQLWLVLRPFIFACFVGSAIVFIIKRLSRYAIYVTSGSRQEARIKQKRIFALIDLIDCLRGLSQK